MALTIVTNPISSINTTTATSGGNSISGTVTGSIIAKGVCYGLVSNPFLPRTSILWSKSAFVATVTSVAHGMSNGTSITVSASSNTTAVPNGTYVITVTNDILKKLSLVGYDLDEYSLDTVKMFYKDATEAGFKL